MSSWEIFRKSFSITLINSFGQIAHGSSEVSLEEALAEAEAEMSQIAPPSRRRTSKNLLEELGL